MFKALFGHAALPLVLGAAMLLPLSHAARAADQGGPAAVRVTFDIAQPKGAIMVALYDSEASYKASRPTAANRVEVAGPTVTKVFQGLKPGRYAIQSYQDLNGDGQLNRNPLGMPTEPFAFSNNAPPRFGPAAWSDAAFDVGPGETAQHITLR
jgi:uncharacterized protein (DUF2141 family)